MCTMVGREVGREGGYSTYHPMYTPPYHPVYASLHHPGYTTPSMSAALGVSVALTGGT